MFEDIIAVLDSAGVEYNEDYEAGTLTVDVANLDKDTLIEVISTVQASGLDFTIDATSLVVQGEPTTESTEEEGLSPEEGTEAALDEYLGQ